MCRFVLRTLRFLIGPFLFIARSHRLTIVIAIVGLLDRRCALVMRMGVEHSVGGNFAKHKDEKQCGANASQESSPSFSAKQH
jgi:hypothetical protein